MGVKDLWEVLDQVKEPKKLDLLSSKRIAIDLSGWVVQAETRKGLNCSKYSYIRLLYYRVRHLLLHGIHPVFILEGKMPEIKEKEFRRRNHLENTSSGSNRPKLNKRLNECQKLLESLGVPCLKASGEAEAYCAYLCLNKRVDAVMSEDSDAILYGADPVYRGFKMENEKNVSWDVLEYSLKNKKNELNLNREKCIALALVLGCDYGGKVSSIGVRTVLKFLIEAKEMDILQRFQDWKTLDESQIFPGLDPKVEKMTHCSYCGHIGRKSIHDKDGCRFCASKVCLQNSDSPCSCAWHENNEIITAHKYEMKIYNAVKNIEDFPNDKLIKEYLNYTDNIPDDTSLEWKCPNINDFKNRTTEFISPTFDWLKEILPIISAWQFLKLERFPENTSEFLLRPIKIKKNKIMKKVKYFVVEWNLKDEDEITVVETDEPEHIFQKAYPKIVEEFYDTKEKSKTKKVVKPAVKSKKVISDLPIPPSTLNNINVIEHECLKEFSFENLSNIKNSFDDAKSNISINQSSGSFSDLPLVERIRLLSLKNEKHVIDQVTSPMLPHTIHTEQNPKTKLSSVSNGIISLVFDSSGFSELSDAGKPISNAKNENLYPQSPFEMNKQLCLVFSDSDDSFISNGSVQEERLRAAPSVLNRQSVLLSNDSNDSFVINKNLCFNEHDVNEMLSVENRLFESPENSSSPKLIYSVNKISKQNNSTLAVNNSPVNFSTPKGRHSKPNFTEALYPQVFNVLHKKSMKFIFSPVVFDSSDDSILN